MKVELFIEKEVVRMHVTVIHTSRVNECEGLRCLCDSFKSKPKRDTIRLDVSYVATNVTVHRELKAKPVFDWP